MSLFWTKKDRYICTSAFTKVIFPFEDKRRCNWGKCSASSKSAVKTMATALSPRLFDFGKKYDEYTKRSKFSTESSLNRSAWKKLKMVGERRRRGDNSRNRLEENEEEDEEQEKGQI